MIKTKNLTPSVFYDRSRDFQFLGRTADVIFNYLKTNINMINTFPVSYNSDAKFINLMATTLGFKETHQYNTKQLQTLCTIFMLAVKNKGNIQSIQYILNMLANVENAESECYVEVLEETPYIITVYIPLTIKDTTLFQDVLNYILPAGVSCNIIRQVAVISSFETGMNDTVNAWVSGKNGAEKNSNTSRVAKFIANDQESGDSISNMSIDVFKKDMSENNEAMMIPGLQDQATVSCIESGMESGWEESKFNFTLNCTHCTVEGESGEPVTTIEIPANGESSIITIKADTGYHLPKATEFKVKGARRHYKPTSVVTKSYGDKKVKYVRQAELKLYWPYDNSTINIVATQDSDQDI